MQSKIRESRTPQTNVVDVFIDVENNEQVLLRNIGIQIELIRQ